MEYEITFVLETDRLKNPSEVEEFAKEVAKEVNVDHTFSDETFKVGEGEHVRECVS